jgi:ClpP class serine protease
VDRVYGLFVETVARTGASRRPPCATPKPDCSSGKAAVAIGLADAIGTFDDALAQLSHPFPHSPVAGGQPIGLFLQPPDGVIHE